MRTCYYKEDFLYPESRVHFHVFKYDFPDLHDHDYWEFFIIGSGESAHIREDKTQSLVEGDACLVHPWDKHKFVSGSDKYSQINFMITDEYFRELLNVISPDLYDRIVQTKYPITYKLNSNMLQEFYQNVHLLQTIDENDIENFVNLNKCIWFDIIKIVYRNNIHANHDYPDWLNDFLYLIRQPENISKSIAELCSFTFFSYSHLTRLFKQYTGETLNDYLVTLRLNYSAMLLRTTDTSILSISSAIGYDSLSHFMQMFKKRFEMTPKEYRKAYFCKPTSLKEKNNSKKAPPPLTDRTW